MRVPACVRVLAHALTLYVCLCLKAVTSVSPLTTKSIYGTQIVLNSFALYFSSTIIHYFNYNE